MIGLAEEQIGILELFQESDWLVFKVMIGVAAGMILADHFIGIGEKKRMGLSDFLFVTIFLPVVLLTLTWPVSKLLVLLVVRYSLGQ
ncbi:hypothetical protein [Marimonas lutisalis]|uniref:hypothetical protein n=1 Tax=Marimonas lutisalis TaxID=2545756 RepID=UPI0010F8AB3D|nr:hypothetical protein [Marimonas lutisalis]